MIDLKLLNYLEDFLTEERKERFAKVLENRTNQITVAVEDVYQMHNASAVIRTCDVFGVQEAHIIELRNSNELDDEIAMGSQKWVNVHKYDSTASCIDTLKNKGYKIIATTPHNDSCLLDDFEFDGKTALFFGTEKTGLSDEVLAKADSYLKIPMVGFTESLNISVSTAILLQSLTTKLKRETNNWELSAGEKLATRLQWAKNSIKSGKEIVARYYEEEEAQNN
ncbi:RNA methyltransferase [Cellulophaga baltica]|uniref:TrmH family RNA methyltransferase n=1 Tax=Cellulophaga TaxID=104264 RepID=UPI001C064DB8|nr:MULTISPECIES: RNA methyltransferase [Cellulophaga]MBU2997424.1 RNA methyltransferase [Cellulophaga baltica]MDO6768821.1 RNA methyltransferase [Cellulophaga sp. 1_MG-2023]